MPEETEAVAQLPEAMSTEQAFGIITQACASVQGNLQTHHAVQNALQVIGQALAPKENRQTRRHPPKKAVAK